MVVRIMPKKDKPLPIDPSKVPMTPDQQAMMQQLLEMMASQASTQLVEEEVRKKKAKGKKSVSES